MKIGVVVDASCDLPRSYIDEHRLIVLPSILEFGEKEIIDSRDAWERPVVPRLSDSRVAWSA